jgi:hypothetical protein
MSSFPVLAVLAANMAVLMAMPRASLGDGMGVLFPDEVGFKATLCDAAAPLEAGCDVYLGAVLVNNATLTWVVSEAVPNTTISIVDARAGKESVLATLDLANGRSGTLTTTDGISYYSNATMGVQELASHMCMGHIFADYENELYRFDSDTDPMGCKALMGGADHSSDDGDSHDMPMGDMPMDGMPMDGMPMDGMPMDGMPMDGMAMGDGVAERSGVQSTVGAAIVFLFGLALNM